MHEPAVEKQCNLNICHAEHDRNVPDINLLSPLLIRGVTLQNRLVYSPMCQYVANEGFADDWHLVHLGSRAVGGASLIFTEATAVTAEGRISKGDLGLWSDEHIAPLARVASFIERMNKVPAIQLAHAGRKGSCRQPWDDHGKYLTIQEGGWPLLAPSAIPFFEGEDPPQEIDKQGIQAIIQAFVKAAKRAIQAGFEIIEVHSAHGYLAHSFLSPISNQRKDEYGGSLENRMRFLLELIGELRKTIPEEMPLFVRISATDWVEGGWDIDQSIVLCHALKSLGVDLIDVSSGGTVPHAQIPVKPGYQVPFSTKIREACKILTGAVGLITEPNQANDVIVSGQADLTFIGREMMRNPYFGLQAEKALDHPQSWPLSYGYAVRRS
ncbi:MAG: oxidoreductase [Chlamydiales bacterium 38-26]|nr:NADH:flavin oxidoreductase/NADH oxidase [Chlamydiales bacterium]OJV10790.1 MAG: oxidoreductase [Chlamydiales bacterium 38-26]